MDKYGHKKSPTSPLLPPPFPIPASTPPPVPPLAPPLSPNVYLGKNEAANFGAGEDIFGG